MSKSVTFKRTNTKGDVVSTIEVLELALDENLDSKKVDGIEVQLDTLKPFVSGKDIKCYVVVEKLEGKGVTSIDFLYGNLPMEDMIQDESLRRQCFSKVLSDKNIEIIRRRCCGAIPPVKKGYYGDLEIEQNYDQELVNAIKSQIQQIALKDICPEEKRPENTSSKKVSHPLWESFKKYANKNVKNYPGNNEENEQSTTSLSQEPPESIEPNLTGIVFYSSGGVIIDGKYCTRINYIVKDSETNNKLELNSMLVSKLDYDRLRWDEYYRKRFISQVCTPTRLKNTRNKEFPYIGSFNEEASFENDFDLSVKVAELREESAREV